MQSIKEEQQLKGRIEHVACLLLGGEINANTYKERMRALIEVYENHEDPCIRANIVSVSNLLYCCLNETWTGMRSSASMLLGMKYNHLLNHYFDLLDYYDEYNQDLDFMYEYIDAHVDSLYEEGYNPQTAPIINEMESLLQHGITNDFHEDLKDFMEGLQFMVYEAFADTLAK